MKYSYAMVIHPTTETIYAGFRNVNTEKLVSFYQYFVKNEARDISEFAIVLYNDGHIKQESFTDWYQKATATA